VALLLAAFLVSGSLGSLQGQDKVALVLSGGGAQGLAHIGVLKAFEEYAVPIDLIVGTSAGALVGGLYASGLSVEQLETMAKDGTIMELFLGRTELTDSPVWLRRDQADGNFSIRRSKDRITGPPGLFNDQLIWRDLFLLTAPATYTAQGDFDSLYIPFRAVGAEVVRQESVVFDSGSVAEALRISMSMPMVYPAIIRDGAIYMDGGLYNNMPTDIARELGADFVIAVNVDDVPPAVDNLKDVFDFFDFYSGVLFSFSDSASVSGWDVFINVDTKGFNLFDFAQGDALIQRGYEAGVRTVEQIVKQLDHQEEVNENRRIQYQSGLDGSTIRDIRWVDLEKGNVMDPPVDLVTSFSYSSRNITDMIHSLYATRRFDLIIPSLSASGDTLILTIRSKAPLQMIPEIQISSVNGFNILGNWESRPVNDKYILRSRAGLGNYEGGTRITLRPNVFLSSWAKEETHWFWEGQLFADYRVVDNITDDDAVGMLTAGAGGAAHRVVDWNREWVAEATVRTTRWIHLSDTLTPDYSRAVYPRISVRYESNHIRQTIPVVEGWRIAGEVLAGYWDQVEFYGGHGSAELGLPLGTAYHGFLKADYQKVTSPAPLFESAGAELPVAFTQSRYLDYRAYGALNITAGLSRTLFRDDILVTVSTHQAYLEKRIFTGSDGWNRSVDISIQYNSILGPLELGWSVLDDDGYRLVSWTRLHIYF